MTLRERPSAWTVVAVLASVALAVVVIGDRFWGGKSDSNVTAWQVTQLTQAVRDLATKFDGLAKQSSVDVLASKVDQQAGSISTLNSDMTGAKHDIASLRDDVNGILHPPFRNPKN